jgi:hypothetical protein
MYLYIQTHEKRVKRVYEKHTYIYYIYKSINQRELSKTT